MRTPMRGSESVWMCCPMECGTRFADERSWASSGTYQREQSKWLKPGTVDQRLAMILDRKAGKAPGDVGRRQCG